MSLTDDEIISAVLQGDKERFIDLMARYQHYIFSLCYRMVGQREEAEDVLQETFLAAFEGLARFRFDSSFSTWLRSIALHHCFKACKRRARIRHYELVHTDANKPIELYLPQQGKQETIRKLQNQEILARVAQTIHVLPPKQRAVFVLKAYEGFSLREIAGMLHCSVGTVKSQLSKARVKISQALSFNHSAPERGRTS